MGFGSLATKQNSKRSPVPPLLPVELWYHIASYIPLLAFEKRRLYGLNRELFAYYTERKYGTVNLTYETGSFGISPSLMLGKQLEHLQTSPLITHLTRSLEICFREDKRPGYRPPSVYPPVLVPAREPRSFLQMLFGRKKQLPLVPLGPRRVKPQPEFPPMEKLEAAASRFDNLVSIKCSLETKFFGSIFIPFSLILPSAISSAWTASSATLTTLHLCFEMRTLPPLGLDDISFPRLQDFKLQLRPLPSSLCPRSNASTVNSLEEAKRNFLVFMIKHQRQLVKLSFALPGSQFAADLLSDGLFFELLEDFEYEFKVKHDSIILEPLALFLTRHGDRIRKLSAALWIESIPVPSPLLPANTPNTSRWEYSLRWWEAQSLLNVEYGTLKSFTLAAYLNKPLALWVIKKVLSTVTELNLDYLISTGDFPEIMKAIQSSTHRGRQLQLLRIKVDRLQPALFRILADGLPHLKTLYVTHTGIGLSRPDEAVSFLRVYENFITSSDRVYPDWALERLYLQNTWREVTFGRDKFRAALVQMLPSVKYFNGLLPTEYIARYHDYDTPMQA